ncbi:MAG: polysaccharide deacetylase family protein [Myxococcales bacterium]|nr:polysaccharide deacetylase family protein [Myxococcales bacterium]
MQFFTTFAAVAVLTSLTGCADAPVSDAESHVHSEAELRDAFEQAYREKDDDKADGTGCSGVRVPDRPGFGKRIALTFDDGPNLTTTPLVLETLRRHQVPATFFINGSRVSDDRTRALVQEIADEPDFILANHSHTHPNLAELGSAAVASQIDRTEAVIRQTSETAHFFRFPFGSSTCATAESVRSRGLTITGWHIDSADWCFGAGDGYCKPSTFRYVPDSFRGDMGAYVLNQARANAGGVLLFHDTQAYTARKLDDVLTQLKAEGFSFVSLADAQTFPLLNGQSGRPPVQIAQKYIGDPCAVDTDCGFVVEGQSGRCHAAGLCTIGCEGWCRDLTGKAPTFCIQDPYNTVVSGICVPQAVAQNGHCADLPGTIDVSADRYLGMSTATAKSAEVCMPAPR